MRNLILVVLTLFIFSSCQGQKPDIAAEKNAVKSVILKQLDAFENLSYEGEAAIWAHEPHVVKESAGKVTVGWDSLSADYKMLFEAGKKDPENYTIKFKATNFDIRVNGNFAACLCDEEAKGVWQGKDYHHNTRSVKYLEKRDGEWKIVAVF